jgi:hypothetical protein
MSRRQTKVEPRRRKLAVADAHDCELILTVPVTMTKNLVIELSDGVVTIWDELRLGPVKSKKR